MKTRTVVWTSVVFAGCLALLAARVGDSGPEFGPVAFSPGGKEIIFPFLVGKSSHLFKATLADGMASRLTNSDCGVEYDADFSEAGDAIAFVCSGHIYVTKSDGSGTHLLIPSDGKDGFPRFSPDGSKIYFGRYSYYGHYSPIATPSAHEWNIWVVDLADGKVKLLTKENFYGIGELSISPDGKEMIVSTLDKGILIYSTNGGAAPRTFNPLVRSKSSLPTSEMIHDAQYSKDGASIVFSFASDGGHGFDYDVYSVRLDTGALDKLTTRNGYVTDLRVSPDGRSAVFQKWSKNWRSNPVDPSLYILSLDTKELRKLNISFKD